MELHWLQQLILGLRWFTDSYRVVTVGYSGLHRLQQVTEWLQCVSAVYSKLPSSYSGLQQVTEWLQWVTAAYIGVTVRYR